MTIKNEVAEFLQKRGTPATPKHIAKEIGRGTAGNIARALRDLTNEGKVIRSTRPVQNGWVTYEWKPSYSAGIQGGTVNKFTVGSEWRNQKGNRAVILRIDAMSMLVWHSCSSDATHNIDGTHQLIPSLSLLAPWSEPKPEEVSELRELFSDYCEGSVTLNHILCRLIESVEALQKPAPSPVGKTIDASNRRGEVWVNIYQNGNRGAIR